MTAPRRHMNIYERSLERFARTPPGYWFVRNVPPRVDPPLLRMTGGRFSTVYPAPAMLLTTTGAKSGRPRALPLLYAIDGDSLILIASNYGRPGHPSWYPEPVDQPDSRGTCGKVQRYLYGPRDHRSDRTAERVGEGSRSVRRLPGLRSAGRWQDHPAHPVAAFINKRKGAPRGRGAPLIEGVVT
jgi:deazaflavin-dependent oxidoreductase (nitroreductase family)